MPTPTYTALATVTLGTATSSVTFSSIPATYRDLIVAIDQPATVESEMCLRLNGDTGSNYLRVWMEGTSGGATSGNQTTNDRLFLGNFGTVKCILRSNIMDYSATDKHKTLVSRADGSGTKATASRWANTAAVTSVTVLMNQNNVPSGTRIDLYGVIA
jgi:hypothetical protein